MFRTGWSRPGTLRWASRWWVWESLQLQPGELFGCPFGFTKLGNSSSSSQPASVCEGVTQKCLRPAFSGQVDRSRIGKDTPMEPQTPVPKRFIGLDVHKHYLVAYGVDANLTPLLGPRRVTYGDLAHWIGQVLTQADAVVLEMTTNTWELYDTLRPHVQSVTVVHPPHIALITRSQVMNDKIAARVLATLLAKGLLVGIWVPPEEVRQQRALIAQRTKMTRLATQAKNRLHAILHSHCLQPASDTPFAPDQREWWLGLPLAPLEQAVVRSNLDTLAFAQQQLAALEETLTQLGGQEERLPLLVQLSGIGLINGLTTLAAIGDIARFSSPKKRVGYAGLGSRVHDSGQTTRTGQITKAGRRDLRVALVEAAQVAANTHPRSRARTASPRRSRLPTS